MPDKSEISSLFDSWSSSLRSGKIKEILSHYAYDAILLPTMSAKLRRNHTEIRDYFEFFLQFKPWAEIQEENIRIFEDVAINSGIYIFNLTQQGEVTKVSARFTIVYKRFESKWQIVEHHSSVLPASIN